VVRPLFGQDCRFEYWQVIPVAAACEVLHLPDFDSRPLPPDQAAPAHVRRFCVRYEVKAGSDRQEVGDCYTGEGDRSGPLFKVGDRQYLADLYFEGCLKGQEARGIVFAPGGWSKAPGHLKRFWPVASLPKKLQCPF
jgi:hypothetical protein